MLRAGAIGQILEPGERTIEIDAPPCAHCGFILLMAPGFRLPHVMIRRLDGSSYRREAGWCRGCARPLCPRCAGGACVPYEQRVDREEAAARKGQFLCL